MQSKSVALHLAYAIWAGALVLLYQIVVGVQLTVATATIPVAVALGYLGCASEWKVDVQNITASRWGRVALVVLVAGTFFLAIEVFSGQWQWLVGTVVGITGGLIWYLRSVLNARKATVRENITPSALPAHAQPRS